MTEMRIYDSTFFGDGATGYTKEYEWDAEVEIVGGIAGKTPCPGCMGEPCPEDERDNTDLGCIECKDTGFVLVSI